MQFVLQVKNEMGSGISQATGQIQGLGDAAQQTQTKAKSSGMGVGQAFQFVALNAFNLASSLIQTKRSYEDLGKAENAQKNKRSAVIVATNNLKKAEISLAVARQKGDPARIAKAELTLENAKIRVGKATANEKLGQIELNRAHEDFYLNIIPNVISGLGTIFGLFQVMQGVGGIKGLISGFAKLALPIAIISGIFLAIKTNFLGVRDALTNLGKDLGNQVPALKPFLNILESIGELLGLVPPKKGQKAGGGLNKAIADLKKEFGPIIGFFQRLIDDVMKGDWSKAFLRIQMAAQIAWKEIKKAFPLIGDIESLVNKIKGGNWKGALLQIWKAAVDVWNTIKKAVPFLGDIEAFIRAIAEGKWSVAFEAIKKAIIDSGLPAAIDKIFGTEQIDNFITRFTQIPEIIKANINAGSKKPLEGTGILDTILDLDLDNFSWDGFVTKFKANLLDGFDLNAKDIFWGDKNPPGKAIVESIFASANTWIKENVDKFVVSLFDAKTWTNALDAINKTKPLTDFVNVLFEALFGKVDQKTGKNAKMDDASAQVGGMIVTSLQNWFTDVMPGTTTLFTAFWNGLKKAWAKFEQKLTTDLLGTQIANTIIKGVSDTFSIENVGKVIHAFVNAIKNALQQVKQDFINIGIMIGNFIWNAIPPWLRQFLPGGVGSSPKKLAPNTGGGAGRAAGFHGVATGPMVVGERSAERVDITPMSDIINRRQQSGGTGIITVIVPVMLNGKQIAEVVASEISVNQAVYR
jgi:hypothetical protein